ncbi:hypothetical protein DBV05_g2605 [Lasiodiplodia theobromae]|uniref:F-box domain-containing protein n=1 Tax=Lasiodiplodia theobromae TaxID=45133 RepID=A0A5N5DLN2_9PEZI|nr:hypothetical protein DBV05_g2605 [Lasiodiplodia theobromae]
MDQLPPEIVALVVSFLDEGNVGAYATVSRQWQVAIENVTFRRLRVQSSELALFSERLAHPRRRATLGEIAYEVILPAYSVDRCAKFERRREREVNNAAFNKAITELFALLKSWEEEDGGRSGQHHAVRPGGGCRGISLHLGAYALTDVATPRPLDWYRDLGEHRYEKSVLGWVDLENVPEVRRITELHTPGSSASTRQLRAASVAQIASKLPNLAKVWWSMNDCAFSEDEIRHKYRKDFADALLTIDNRHLTDFSLFLHLEDPQNDGFQMPSGANPADPGVDELSIALHTLLSTSPKLLNFKLFMTLSPSIFGPDSVSSSSSSSNDPSFQGARWPQLRKAEIQMGRTTAAGTWLYKTPPLTDADQAAWVDHEHDSDYSMSSYMTSWSSEEDVDPDDSDWAETYHPWHDGLITGQRPRRYFRCQVDTTVLEPFILAASRMVMEAKKGEAGMAERNVPRLEALEIQVGEDAGGWDSDREKQIYWACFDGRVEDGGKRKVEVVTVPGNSAEPPSWNPSKQLRELWEDWVGEDGKLDIRLSEDYY